MVKTKQQLTAYILSFPVLGCCLALDVENMEREKCMNETKRFNALTRVTTGNFT
ncbi:MAG TPA: hypothetical protein VGB11_08175 [Candidatus Bathyarchaeia archaeon]